MFFCLKESQIPPSQEIVVKLRHILIYTVSFLLASLFPINVYGEESSQSIGDNSNCSAQLKDSHENHVHVTCNIYNINNPEPVLNINQTNPSPEKIESTHSSNSVGYKPEQNSPPQITSSPGYKPE